MRLCRMSAPAGLQSYAVAFDSDQSSQSGTYASNLAMDNKTTTYSQTELEPNPWWFALFRKGTQRAIRVSSGQFACLLRLSNGR